MVTISKVSEDLSRSQAIHCDTCEKLLPFLLNNRQLKSKHHFCDRKCMDNYWPIYKSNCNYCNNEIISKNSSRFKNKLHFCNYQCQKLYMQNNVPMPSKEELYNKYVINKIPVQELAKEYKVGYNKIIKWINFYNIEIQKYNLVRGRKKSKEFCEKLSNWNAKNRPKHSATFCCIQCGKINTILKSKLKTQSKCGKRLFCNHKCRASYVNGTKHHRYIDNTSGKNNKYPYEFSVKRHYIIGRENNICAIDKINIGNNVHHIDYNILNNNNTNLIALCSSCHAKTNMNRMYWNTTLSNISNIRETQYIGDNHGY